MIKKRLFSLLLAVVLLAVWVVPATADKPDMWKGTFGPMLHPVADCEPYGYHFWIWNTWYEEEIFHNKLNKDGSLNYTIYQAKMTHTFTAVPDTGKVLSGSASDIMIDLNPDDTYYDIRGTFQKIIIPGVGPIFQDSGRKVFIGYWNPDGTLTFELLFNAGPSSYTSNDFSALCAALAP